MSASPPKSGHASASEPMFAKCHEQTSSELAGWSEEPLPRVSFAGAELGQRNCGAKDN